MGSVVVAVVVGSVVDMTGVPGGSACAVGKGENAGQVATSPGVEGLGMSSKALVQPLASPGTTCLRGGSCQGYDKHCNLKHETFYSPR